MLNEWISVKDRLPEKSGYYLCYTNVIAAGFWAVYSFSKKHKKFNVHDDQSKTFAKKFHTTPDYWMPLPKLPKGGVDND